jgi:hypothetical protein
MCTTFTNRPPRGDPVHEMNRPAGFPVAEDPRPPESSRLGAWHSRFSDVAAGW